MLPSLQQRILLRLGFTAAPPADLQGLTALYAAWSASVPFDNVRKLVALHRNDRTPLPGTDAHDFFESWLRHGTGGTCWAGSTALHALLESLGFDVRRAAGSMRDLGIPNHGTVKVRVAGRDYLVDSSMLTGAPVPLDDVPFRSGREGGVEVETDRGSHVVWFDSPPHAGLFPCRLLLDQVDATFFRDAHERTRASSPFNATLYARRNRDGRRIVLKGSTKYTRTAAGTTEEALDREGLLAALREDIGISSAMAAEWAASGALDDCYAPLMGPNLAPLSLVQPSRRAPAATS